MRFGIAKRSSKGVAWEGRGWLDASIDHVIPRSEGGSSLWDNLALAHQECNSSRHGANFDVDELRDAIALKICSSPRDCGPRAFGPRYEAPVNSR
jgi:hypothetical protein